MAKVYKVTAFYVNRDGNHETPEDLINTIERDADNADLSLHIVEVKESEEFEWDDDIDINYTDATTDVYEKYIKE